jgi:uncharacterized tellurite resistance protein B-like protein
LERFTVTREQAVAAIRAMKAVAIADGTVGGHEINLLRAAARALEVEDAIDSAPLHPTQVASVVTDPIARLRLIQAMEMMVIMDGRVDPSELAACEAFAKALGVDEPRLANLRQITRGQMRTLQLDLLRRSPMAHMAEEVFQKEGLRGLWRFGASTYGGTKDPDLAWRYKQLGLLPEGTFGHAYWAHMTERQLPFPGEHLGFPEELVRHDLVHVLSGYGTDVPGECENAAFIAGFLKHDPFAYLFMVAVHTHLDIEVFPSDPSQAFLGLDPERVIRALTRGMQVNRDLYDLGWDFWPEFPRPLADVRAELGIA